MKTEYKFLHWRIIFIFIVISLFAIPMSMKTTDEKVCYKSEASIWGRQDLVIDCNSNNVDLTKNREYLDFGLRQLKNMLIATLIINSIIWLMGLDFAKGEKDE